jgi:hypothetical protein
MAGSAVLLFDAMQYQKGGKRHKKTDEIVTHYMKEFFNYL